MSGSWFFCNIKLMMLKICTICTPVEHWIILMSELLGMVYKENNSEASRHRWNCKKQLGRRAGRPQMYRQQNQGGNKTMLQCAHLCFLISSLKDLLPGFLPERFVSISLGQFTFFFLPLGKGVFKKQANWTLFSLQSHNTQTLCT